jgi:hypothetical protein
MKPQIQSFKKISKNILLYFEICGILLTLYVSLFTQIKKYLLTIFFLDVSIDFCAKWVFEDDWESYLMQRWIRRIVTIPLYFFVFSFQGTIGVLEKIQVHLLGLFPFSTSLCSRFIMERWTSTLKKIFAAFHSLFLVFFR